MIHTSKTVAVGNQESIIDSPIVLYRGDREVEVEFTLTGNKYTFSNGGNVIKSVNATHGQLVLNTPTGENAFSEVTECHDGKVVFIITKEMIDELIEVGFYSFQIRLFDENQVSRVSIPPVYKGIDIRNPIAAEDETNVVDIGLVDYAVVVKDEFEDLSTFLPDGNYNKTEWESKDVISGAKLNKIEDALYNINSNMEATDLALLNMVENINKNVRSEINKLGNELESEVEQFKIDTNAAMAAHKNEVSDELEHNANYLIGSENILNYIEYTHKDSSGRIIWDNALKKAMENNSVIYFPKGTYRFNCKNIILNEGNVLCGDGELETKLVFDVSSNLPAKDTTKTYPPISHEVEEGEFIFRYANKTGFKNLTISTANEYHGDVLLLEPGKVVASRRYYILENVHISFPWKSGYGNGFTIKLQNFDENGVFADGRSNSLVFFYVNNLEVTYGHKGLNVQGKQKGTVQNQAWMTATTFSKCRFNSCVFGIYFELINNGDKDFLDFQDIKFIDTEIQVQGSNYYNSTIQQGVGIYSDGGSHPWRLGLDFTNLTVWDSRNKINGILKDTKITVNGFFASNKLTAKGYVQGFENNNSLISIDNDVARHRYTNQSTGNISEFNIIDGGIEFINTPDGGHGYAAKGKLYEELMPTELNNQNNYYSHVMLEDYNKNGVIDGYLEIGMGIGHNDQLVGRCNLYSKSSDFTLREVVTYGNEYIYYSDTTSQQGFYAGNGMYIKDERTTVTVPAKEGYQFVEIPIQTKYTYSPFLISCNLHYSEPYNDTVSYDVFIRTSQISKLSDGSHVVRVLLKHNKPSEITLRFSNILCGYMEYKNRIKK